MSTTVATGFAFEHTYARDVPELVEPWQAASAPDPSLLVLNTALAEELGLDPDALRSDAGVRQLVGNEVPGGAEPVAMAYAGHQFGGYSPRLGDGRALLLGEHVTAGGRRVDVHLKGSGRTPFARGGDGKAAVGPMLREHLIGESMHALGIPTTRALAVVATGEHISRDTLLPGAVLVRVAASHLRVGTFQYAAATADGGHDVVRRLADHAIARHHPAAAASDRPHLALFESVVEAQAKLVAQWMLVGFVHGVMNTDNMTISGETIDYGPCAFIDRYHPATVFSSIDHGGRYAYGNQPSIAQWNLARLAETLLPLVHPTPDIAAATVTEVLHTFPDRLTRHWTSGMRHKLGITVGTDDDTAFFGDLLALMAEHRTDHTGTFRALAATLGNDCSSAQQSLVAPLAPWVTRWRERLTTEGRDLREVARGMDRVNPLYVPRNHLVEAALTAATDGDLEPFRRLVDVVLRPHDARPGLEQYAAPAPDGSAPYRTFCGT